MISLFMLGNTELCSESFSLCKFLECNAKCKLKFPRVSYIMDVIFKMPLLNSVQFCGALQSPTISK